MDTISGSVSTLKIPTAAALHPKSHHLHHFNRHFHHHHQPHLIISSTSTNYSKLPNNNKTSSTTTAAAFTTTSTAVAHSNNNFTTNNKNNPPFVSRQSFSKPEESFHHHHRKASTGYAVALLDAARVHNVLELAKRDVKRLSKWLSNEQLSSIIENPCVEKKEKGEILREVMKRGKLYYKHLGKLVNLLVEKDKVEMLKDVLLEFQRIMYDELSIKTSNVSSSRPQVVLVPCEMKMEENEIVGIAERIQKITGADKIVVRQLLR